VRSNTQRLITEEVLNSVYGKPNMATRILTNIMVVFYSKSFGKKGI